MPALSTHGDVIAEIVGWDAPCKKGSIWILEVDGRSSGQRPTCRRPEPPARAGRAARARRPRAGRRARPRAGRRGAAGTRRRSRCRRATRGRARGRCRSARHSSAGGVLRSRPNASPSSSGPSDGPTSLRSDRAVPPTATAPPGSGGVSADTAARASDAERRQLLPARRISVRDARAQAERAEVDRPEPGRPVLDRSDRDLGGAAADVADRDRASGVSPGEGALEREAGLVLARQDAASISVARESRWMSCGAFRACRPGDATTTSISSAPASRASSTKPATHSTVSASFGAEIAPSAPRRRRARPRACRGRSPRCGRRPALRPAGGWCSSRRRRLRRSSLPSSHEHSGL